MSLVLALEVIFFSITITIAYLIYHNFIGPSKLERDIKRIGGNHPCFYCKKEIHIDDAKCTHCHKPNYKSIRKGRLKYFYITGVMYLMGIAKLYKFLFPM